ncbi:MAG TPA: DUF4340 domain-containing protein [Thermoanaerobaculia bacterium]|nr:DUF4340 domain-containing protein [Thermoanaerobaculia bacterium]
MSPKRLAVLTGVLLVLFAFVAFFERKMPTTQERLDKGDVIWDVNEAKIGKIEINRDNMTLAFERDGDAWRMTRPESYPADGPTLSSLVADLSHPAREGEASASATEPDYGLTAPRAVVTVSGRDGKNGKGESHTLSIGREIPGTDTVAARVKGENRTIFVRSTVAADLLKPVDGYKSKKIFAGSALDVTQLSIARGRGRLEFEKRKNRWWMTRPAADLAASSAVERLIDDLLAANVTEFLKIPRAELAGDGLAPPLYTVSMTISGKPVTADIGATRADGKSVYARSGGETFAIDSTVTDELAKEADVYRETKVARFDNFAAKKLVWSSGGAPREFIRDGAGWKEAGKAVPAASVEDVLTAIGSLEGKDFLAATDWQKISAAPELAAFTVETSTGDSFAASARPSGGGNVAIKLADRPEALVLPAADFDRVSTAVRKIAPAAAPAPAKPAPPPKKKPS